ncbi:endonuclease/exonuclease/phosphatase family protein [Guyparkeria hydrothermalis]|uniref:endonuclease/exonuclease/phosphatase family protein n=1 Tax=Guyparkeria hydrothermalis TaxID=923 RepID=UPI002020DC0B|nr:endonuclease/exonuclease/phosphatase family protein [Guyparkeria hydrothermalis]MCL7744272.1 endonuclease/exonuclease/phosphatase family protein [Guyparkeria hydrothermalis]
MSDAADRSSDHSLRVVTWNGNLSLGKKLDRLLALEPDVAVIQECEQSLPVPAGYRFVWTGSNPRKGLGVISKGLTLEVSPHAKYHWAYFLPVSIGEGRLRMLATWAFNHRASRIGPGYTGNPREVISDLSEWLREGPSVVAGDFNNSTIWDHIGKAARFRDIQHDLDQLGLFSAYHHLTGEAFGRESRPTYFHTKNPDKPFHIDYCFLHHTLRCQRVEIPGFSEWRTYSDHVPVITDLELPAESLD